MLCIVMLHDFYIFFYSKKKLSSHDALTTTHHDLSLYDIQLEKIILVLRIINIVYDDGKIRGFKFQPCFQKFLRKYLLINAILGHGLSSLILWQTIMDNSFVNYLQVEADSHVQSE